MQHSIIKLNQHELKAIVGGNHETTPIQALYGIVGTIMGMLAHEYIFSPAIDTLENWWEGGSNNTKIKKTWDNETATCFFIIASVAI